MQTYRATILGGIWWPYGATCSTEREFAADDDADALERAMTTEAGDFSSVIDVQLWRTRYGRLTELVKDWDSEDHYCAYVDTLPEDD